MKTQTVKNHRELNTFFSVCKKYKLITLLLVGWTLQSPAQTTQMSKPNWWFGVAGAGNINFYRGSTQQLNENLTVPSALHEGLGLGLFISPLIEYHLPQSNWGFMFQAGYDSRKGSFNKVNSPCNCPEDLSTKLSYLSIEPSIRYTPFGSNFYLYGGSVLGFNLNKSFVYQLEVNPDVPNQIKSDPISGDFSNINSMLLSAHIGVGYDIPLTAAQEKNQFVLSPFITYLPYLGQTPRNMETWSVNTLRIGAIIKFGRNNNKRTSRIHTTPIDIQFSVYAPKNIPTQRRINETFPLRNYIFFDDKSSEIPNRYTLIKKSEVKDFKEDQLEVLSPKRLSGRSDREMVVYYNILNIIGDRMQKNPGAKILLVGSSENGPVEGEDMAKSVKSYLTDVWSIEGNRIATEGNDKPKIPSEKIGGTSDLVLLKEGNRRVSIESTSSELLMEFHSGPAVYFKPVQIVSTQNTPPDSYVTFNVPKASDQLQWWELEISDKDGRRKKFGPYIEDKVMIPGNTILGTEKEGVYNVKMIGKTKDGSIIERESDVNMTLWTPPENEMGIRYSVLFEYNESKAIAIYEKYLTEVVSAKIPMNAKVIIHGHTDIVGDAANNKKLSVERANDVKNILDKSLKAKGRKDVKFEVYGYGEDDLNAPFNNLYPEERFYNRTVIIDIIPNK